MGKCVVLNLLIINVFVSVYVNVCAHTLLDYSIIHPTFA